MIRTQLQLTEEQSRELRRIATREGISISAVVRRLIDQGLRGKRDDRFALYERAAGVVGAFSDRDGSRDVARDHDRYLDEEYR